MSSLLAEPTTVAGRIALTRVVFGPHETNLGRGRAFSDRHVAYYQRRAAGGAGVVVTETASVHPSDWPYERAPLAADCGPGWRQIVAACHPHDTVVLAGLGHDGLQGSSAYSQHVLWAPSPFADANSRELPMQMEQDEIDAVVEGFASATVLAVDAGVDGVEIDAGATSLLRQFHSGLTNSRDDAFGVDRLLLTRQVLAAVRNELGPARILSLRLSCDELAPWAGITPDHAAEQVATLAPLIDLLVVVRGGPYSVAAYRPDAHTPPVFNRDLCARMRAAAAGRCLVVLQGSVVDAADAESAIADGVADLVEMTRAQIADADLVAKTEAGGSVRPCVLCNQRCRVRDNRNPVVTCITDPRSGHETVDTDPAGTDAEPGRFLVVGAGVGGLETARVLAGRGHTVRIVERRDVAGGALNVAAVGPGRVRLARFVDWLITEVRRLGVPIQTEHAVTPAELDAARARGEQIVLATGSRPGPADFDALPALELLEAGVGAVPAGRVVVHDPIGGPIGVAVAEWLVAQGREVAIVVPDQIVGTQLSLTGDLVDANVRLQRAGVVRELRAAIHARRPGVLVLADVWTADGREIACDVLVDAGPRQPDESLYRVGRPRVGDCLAPRTVHEAVLEARRVALLLAGANEAIAS